MTATVTAKNTSSGPVVIDADGHILGGGEWGDVDPDAHRVKDAIAAGLLVIPDDTSPAPPPAEGAAARDPAGGDEPSAGSKARTRKDTS